MLYTHLPQSLTPVAISIGSIQIHWYSLMWLMAFGTVYGLLLWRVKKGEYQITSAQLTDILFYSMIGAVVGGRLGYVLFYDFSFYLAHPLAIISPYDFATNSWRGIYGMSYHGGFLGVVCALWYLAKKEGWTFVSVIDFVVPAVPLGYFFGRLGNFFNGELVGRVTHRRLGMDFGDGVLRHPSQLYEAVGEGIVLFLFLWPLRHKKMPPGTLAGLYVIGYASMRFLSEFFRAPDAHLGFIVGIFTMGQILSFVMFFGGLFVVWLSLQRARVTKFPT